MVLKSLTPKSFDSKVLLDHPAGLYRQSGRNVTLKVTGAQCWSCSHTLVAGNDLFTIISKLGPSVLSLWYIVCAYFNGYRIEQVETMTLIPTYSFSLVLLADARPI